MTAKKKLTVRERKIIFQRVVALEDSGVYAPETARHKTSLEFGITTDEVADIVDEAIRADWELPALPRFKPEK